MVKALRYFIPLFAVVVALAQSPAPGSVLKVGGKVMEAGIITKVTPRYPVAMKARGQEAEVTLAVLISSEGVPVSISVENPGGPREFSDAAIDAVKQWRYKPTLLNGQPVDVMTTIQINFAPAK